MRGEDQYSYDEWFNEFLLELKHTKRMDRREIKDLREYVDQKKKFYLGMIKSKDSKNKRKIESKNSQITELRSEIPSLKKKLSESRIFADRCLKDISDYESRLESIETELLDYKSKSKELRDKLSSIYRRKFQDSDKNINDKNFVSKALYEGLDRLNSEYKETIKVMENEMKSLKTSIIDKEKEITHLKGSEDRLYRIISGHRAEISRRDKEINQLKFDLKDRDKLISELKYKLSMETVWFKVKRSMNGVWDWILDH